MIGGYPKYVKGDHIKLTVLLLFMTKLNTLKQYLLLLQFDESGHEIAHIQLQRLD